MSLKSTFSRFLGRQTRPRRNARNQRKQSRRAGNQLRRPQVPNKIRLLWNGLVYRVSWSLRMFVRSLPYVMVAVVLALTPVAVVYGYRYVTATPEFRVQNVHIEGHRQLGIEEVLETANVAHAPNILKLNLRDVEAALLAHPWVVSASVRRELPAQLFIKIVERTPVALLALDGPLYLVDKHANIFSRIETDKHFDLPVLTGLTRNDLAAEATQDRKALTRSLVRGALTLMDIWRTSSIGQRINVSEIHMDPLLGLSVILGEGAGIHRGGTVRIGRGHLQDKLERLEAIVDHAAAEGQSIAKVMLDNDIDPSRVAVSFKQPDLTTAKKDDVSKVDTEAKTGEQASPNRRPGGRSKREAKPHNVR